MKKKIRQTILLVCVCFYCQNLFSQNCGPLSSTIPTTEAEKRIAEFEKKAIYLRNNKISSKSITIGVDKIKEMLTDFRDKQAAKNYDGLRIYFFIVPKKLSDSARLSALFVPTMKATGEDMCHKEYSNDDSENAYYFSGKTLEKANLNSIQDPIIEEIILGRRIYGNHSEKIPGAIGRVFQEAKSNWYSKETFFIKGSNPELPDLLTYLEGCMEIEEIEIYFGSFLKHLPTPISCEKYWYKSHPIFKIGGNRFTSLEKFFSLNGEDIKKKFNNKKKKKMMLDKAYTDTGLPCPPNKCN